MRIKNQTISNGKGKPHRIKDSDILTIKLIFSNSGAYRANQSGLSL